MKVLGFHIIIAVLCGFLTAMHAMDERAIVSFKKTRDCKIPISFIRTYVQRTLLHALEHETLFMHNCLRTQKHVPEMNSALEDKSKDKVLVRYIPQSTWYQYENSCVIRDRDDDYDIHINIPPSEHTFLSEQDFDRISRMPEGPMLCFCNTLCGAAMLGLVLILTFCR